MLKSSAQINTALKSNPELRSWLLCNSGSPTRGLQGNNIILKAEDDEYKISDLFFHSGNCAEQNITPKVTGSHTNLLLSCVAEF